MLDKFNQLYKLNRDKYYRIIVYGDHSGELQDINEDTLESFFGLDEAERIIDKMLEAEANPFKIGAHVKVADNQPMFAGFDGSVVNTNSSNMVKVRFLKSGHFWWFKPEQLVHNKTWRKVGDAVKTDYGDGIIVKVEEDKQQYYIYIFDVDAAYSFMEEELDK